MNALTTTHPAFIGFENLFRQMENTMRRTDTYPPHNVIKHDEDVYSLELALAGYSRGDITVETAGGVLTITGKKGERDDVEYIHRGIGARGFSRSFNLAEHMNVTGCFFIDGLLIVRMWKRVPEDLKPKTLEIHERMYDFD